MATKALMMETTAPRKLFHSYLFPAMLGMVLMAINILIDGLFVSHGVGEIGLAAINIAVPIFSIIISISLWIGIGGATLYSISLGKKDVKRAKQIFTHAIVLTLLVTTIVLGTFLLFQRQFAYLFGANDHVLPYVEGYLHIILLFGIVYVLENILSIFIRNDGNPQLAMFGLITTSVVNIILNYVFILQLDWGVEGAAYATVYSTIVGVIVMLTHFLKKDKNLGLRFTKIDFSIYKNILAIGLPSFIVEGSTAIMMIGFNITFNHYLGDTGVVAYAVVNYMHTVFLMLFIGVGMAIQPITSYHHGAGLNERNRLFVKIAVQTGFAIGLIVLFAGIIGQNGIIKMFAVSTPEAISFTKTGIMYFFLGYLFLGVNIVFIEFYQSVEKIRLALWFVVSRSFIFFLPLLWLLPKLFGPNAIWLAFPLAELLTTMFIFTQLRYRMRSTKTMNEW